MASRHEELYEDSAMEAIADHFADDVTYHRAAVSASLTAIPRNRTYWIVNDSGFSHSVQIEDFQFVTEDLVLSGSAITPRKGDRIKRTLGGVVHVYEVMPLGNKPCYEQRVGSAITIVHTNFIATE